jgi:hypothetical protein
MVSIEISVDPLIAFSRMQLGRMLSSVWIDRLSGCCLVDPLPDVVFVKGGLHMLCCPILRA